jgi:hypothetical protein
MSEQFNGPEERPSQEVDANALAEQVRQMGWEQVSLEPHWTPDMDRQLPAEWTREPTIQDDLPELSTSLSNLDPYMEWKAQTGIFFDQEHAPDQVVGDQLQVSPDPINAPLSELIEPDWIAQSDITEPEAAPLVDHNLLNKLDHRPDHEQWER